jgi:Recombination endonuclease VII
MKRCANCGHFKTIYEFNMDKQQKDGHCCYCRDCQRKINRASKIRNMPAVLTYNAKWQKEHPDRMARYRRNSKLKHYGLTEDEYLAIIEAAGGRCEICRTDKPGGKRIRFWMIDHDHATGDVRGILCENCNRALGMMQDDPDRLRAAAAYLERKAGSNGDARDKQRDSVFFSQQLGSHL